MDVLSLSDSVSAEAAIAASVAEILARTCRVEHTSIEGYSARRFRQETLTHFPGKWLGLRNLLMMCWKHGVPVVYLPELGRGVGKVSGMVVHAFERPVILLNKETPLWSKHLYVLAHELAHICLGRVKPGTLVFDRDLNEDNSKCLSGNDLDAFRFATELINSRPNAAYTLSSDVTPALLADAAHRFGAANHTDPGHIALMARHFNLSAERIRCLALEAATILQHNNPPASHLIGEAMWGGVDPSELPRDGAIFLARETESSHILQAMYPQLVFGGAHHGY